MISRFAPSTTGEAHPGTLLSALLVWLDARHRRGKAILRLEDLDTTRVKKAWADELVEACAWMGLDWDETIVQTARGPAHAAAMDKLAADGRLYPCACSRSDRTGGRRAPDGGWAYENTCRGRALLGDWRDATEPLRLRIDDGRVELIDDGGMDLSQTPAHDMGDPIVRRRDGVIAYQLAVVVDDADEAITDVVRGKDIAPSTATQVLVQRALGVPTPRYRHHFLLLEPRGDKLAKLHGSLPLSGLRAHHDALSLVGILAYAAGQLEAPRSIAPADLVAEFDWARVPKDDRVAVLGGAGLELSFITAVRK
ncbi:MAG TPA: glutamate--tRNA ligase family protein [Kofleriaceae bacterium]